MSDSPPIDIATALQAALPESLYHLVEPVARTLEALADPQIGPAVSQAISQLGGSEVLLASGASVSFDSSSIGGNVTMRDTAGRDLINFTISVAPINDRLPAIDKSQGLDQQQLALLQTLAVLPPTGQNVSYDALECILEIQHHELWDELVLMDEQGWIQVTTGLLQSQLGV